MPNAYRAVRQFERMMMLNRSAPRDDPRDVEVEVFGVIVYDRGTETVEVRACDRNGDPIPPSK